MVERVMKKIKFGLEIFYGDNPDVVPYVQLSPLEDRILASYSGPDSGLAYAEGHTENVYHPNLVAGIRDWNLRDQHAYGICISLYEQHPISGKISGEPIADSFAMCVRKNNAILMVADGVNWGEKSRLAARCALYGAMKYLNYKIFERRRKPENTQDVVRLLRKAIDEAHRAIMAKEGGLTTLCACMVCPVDNSDQHAVCCVNVGDSFAYIYSHNRGIREVTVGSHDVGSERDIRDAGGAVGPVDGQNPELHNLTCSVTFCNKGDIIFLTTDGISDNFDPVVTKVALPMRANDSNFNSHQRYNSNGSLITKPELSPKERHVYSMKEMERVVHEYELVTEEACTAQAFCGALLQHVLMLTDEKRKIIENPSLYAKRKMTKKDRQVRDSEIVEKMSKAAGKLDHATVIAFEVAAFASSDTTSPSSPTAKNGVSSPASSRPISVPRRESESPPTPTSLPLCGSVPLSPLNNHSKKSSGPRKLLAKLKSLPPSPSSPTPPQISSSCPNPTPIIPFRSISPPPSSNTNSSSYSSSSSPHCSFSTPASPQAKSPTSEASVRGSDLHFSPRKFGKKSRSRTSDIPTPTSPTIPEALFENDEVFASLTSRSKAFPRFDITYESNV